MLSSQLHAMTEILPLAGLDRLAEHLPTAWIEEALAATDTASIQRRRLPSEQVVWLVDRSVNTFTNKPVTAMIPYGPWTGGGHGKNKRTGGTGVVGRAKGDAV